MWERFAPRMRRTIVSALDEASRGGQETAGAEHLLLAFAKDRQSAGAYVLEQCGIELKPMIERLSPMNGDPSEIEPSQRTSKLDDSALVLLREADDQSHRLGHHHIGTEHLALALANLPRLDAGKMLRDGGLTPEAARQAIDRWIKQGMPRRRGGMAWRGFRSPMARAVMRPIQKTLRVPGIAWKIFIRKSLAHPRFTTNPYPLYRWLREREPVRPDPLAPVWILSRYEDVATLMRDPRFKKDPFAPERLPGFVREQLGATDARVDIETVSMLFLDPPAHTRVRGMLSRAFTPKTLADLTPRIELIAKKRLDRVEASGRMDLIADLAYPLPVIVIAELLGFPPEDYPRHKEWSDAFAAALALRETATLQAKAALARTEIRQYFNQIVLDLQKKPTDTLISRLLESEGEPDGLNREEIFSNAVLLLAAGHETTTNLIGNGILALLRNRDQWDLLVREPDLADSAVEEMLRYDCPVQWISRMTGMATEMRGRMIPPGQIVLGCIGAANRDPARFPNPDRFDIRRTDNKHLSFGIGIHYCIGAALARMEAQIALRQLVSRFPKMRPAFRRVNWIKGLTFRGVKSLPVILRG